MTTTLRTRNFVLDQHRTPRQQRLELQGELEISIAHRVQDALLDCIAASRRLHPGPTVLDLSGISYIDSSGLDTLRHVIEHHRSAVIHLEPSAHPHVRAACQHAGITDHP